MNIIKQFGFFCTEYWAVLSTRMMIIVCLVLQGAPAGRPYGFLFAESARTDSSLGSFRSPLERENIEFGIEGSFTIQKMSYFSNIEKYYLTCSSTINQDSILKFKIGTVNAECKNTDTDKAIGEFKYIAMGITLLQSFRTPPLRPYIGFGYTTYSCRDFKESDDAFQTYDSGPSNSLNLVGGIKYILAENASINLDLTCEKARLVKFNSSVANYPSATLDLSNISVGLNIALRF